MISGKNYITKITNLLIRKNEEKMLKTQRKELNLFLRRLNSRIFVYSGKMIRTSLDNVLRLGISEKEDVYFYVNPGGTKEHEIQSTHCCFVDLDAGRDSNHKYFSNNKVALKKEKMLALIKKCPVQPHYIIETRNGYQVYWCTLPNDMTNISKKKTWNATQYYIKQYFKEFADPRVGKVNQIMRLPYTIWYKKDERKEPFFVDFYRTPKNFRSYTLSKLYYTFKAESKSIFTPAVKLVTTGINKFTKKSGYKYTPIKPSYIYTQKAQQTTNTNNSSNSGNSGNILVSFIPMLKNLLNMGMEFLGQYEQKETTRKI